MARRRTFEPWLFASQGAIAREISKSSQLCKVIELNERCKTSPRIYLLANMTPQTNALKVTFLLIICLQGKPNCKLSIFACLVVSFSRNLGKLKQD